jgi:hypothetical protein
MPPESPKVILTLGWTDMSSARSSRRATTSSSRRRNAKKSGREASSTGLNAGSTAGVPGTTHGRGCAAVLEDQSRAAAIEEASRPEDMPPY